MRLLQRILLATDLSEGAEDAVATAIYLAQTFESELVLVYVLPPLPELAELKEQLRSEITRRLEAVKQKCEQAKLTVRDTVLAEGVPYETIIHLAEQHDVNAIIVGSGEKDADEQFRLGTTAERLERRSDRPVLVVKRGARTPIQQILCPVDFSDTSRRAAREAIHLARNLQSSLVVCHVVQPVSSLLPQSLTSLSSAAEQQKEAQQSKLNELLKEFDTHGIELEQRVCEGQPHAEILRLARELPSDLLVMGSVGRSGLSRFVLGSVAEKVARELPCSIMTVKSEEFIRLQLRAEIDDIQRHVQRAQSLLEKGFVQEALGEFRNCVSHDPMYAPAWEGAAAAHERLGNADEAEQCRRRAEEIVQQLWDQRIEAEIRSQHLLWRRGLSGR
jgi:nucleotide-binding universal stress UspA family protein